MVLGCRSEGLALLQRGRAQLAEAAWHVMRGKEFDETMLFG